MSLVFLKTVMIKTFENENINFAWFLNDLYSKQQKTLNYHKFSGTWPLSSGNYKKMISITLIKLNSLRDLFKHCIDDGMRSLMF